MQYWLMKSEPETFSWDDMVKKKTTGWDGVRNFQAASNMKAMQIGDRCFFYHSGDEKQIVGIVEVSGLYRSDPSDESKRFGMVEVKAGTPLKTPVTLAAIKADAKLKEMVLVRNSRLSVQPVDAAAWKYICGLGGVKP